MLRKGNVLYCTNRGTFYIALTNYCHSLILMADCATDQAAGVKPGGSQAKRTCLRNGET